jgi:hypothetical protein
MNGFQTTRCHDDVLTTNEEWFRTRENTGAFALV